MSQDDLPPPWVRQFDSNYNTFFYVDPTTNPPRTTWTRPGYEDGQAAPEQLETLNDYQNSQDQGNSGHAASYFNEPQAVSHHTAGYAEEARQQTNQGGTTGGDGERGFVGNMATNMVMSKLGMRPHGGGTAGMVGKLASSFLGGGKQNQYAQPSGPPPFMGGGGGGGIGGMINSFMGKPSQGHGGQSGHGGQYGQQYGQYGQQQQQGGLGGMLNNFMGGSKPPQHGQGYSSQPPGAYGGQSGQYGQGGNSYYR